MKNLSIVLLVLVLVSGRLWAGNESIETGSQGDLGQVSIWLMSEIAQGGYIKPSVNLTVFNDDPYLMGEIEGGWRFTNWFKFGGRFERTFTNVKSINSAATLVGAVAGISGRNVTLGYFTLDLSVGGFELDDASTARLFFEPGFHIKSKLYKRLYWTAGMTYRYVEDESFTLFGSNSLNSLSLKFGVTGHRY